MSTISTINKGNDLLFYAINSVVDNFTGKERKTVQRIVDAIDIDVIHFPSIDTKNPKKITYAEKKEYVYDEKRRRSTTLARFIRRKYNIDISHVLLDKVCAMVTAQLSYNEKMFKLLKKDDIIKAYYNAIGGGSCMTNYYSKYVHLYAENPEKVSLLVYDNQARALLWIADCNTKLLDRIYPNDGYHIEHYKTYAKKHNIIMREHQGAPQNYEFAKKCYKITLNIPKNKKYPHLDSFPYAKLKNNKIILSNRPHKSKHNTYILHQTDGELENSIECIECGELISEERIIYIDGEPYCEECCAICTCCELYRPIFELGNTRDGLVCHSCLIRYYTQCSICGQYVMNEYLLSGKCKQCILAKHKRAKK